MVEGSWPGKRLFEGFLAVARPYSRQAIFFVLLIALFIAFDRPWQSLPPDPTSADISRRWNESIAKLGIQPIFPPQEDIYVGDIYAIIVGLDKSADQTFLGTSVLIGHADVRWALSAKDRDTPTFANTEVVGAADGHGQSRSEVDPPAQYKSAPINLSLVAFPGVTITHSLASSAGLGAPIGKAAIDRGSDSLEQIHIPVAETYGIMPPKAVAALDMWCSAPDTKGRCTRDFALKMLAYAAGDAFLRKRADGTAPRVALIMISRVYCAREFDVRRSAKANKHGSLGAGLAPAAPSSSTSDHGRGEPGRDAANIADMSLSTEQTFSDEEGVKQIFQRPVVFGFRSIQRGFQEISR